MNQNLISTYLKQVKKCCPSSFKKKLIKELHGNLIDFLEDYPDSTMEDIYQFFGSPITFTYEYILAMDDKKRQRLIEHSKWTKRCVLAGVVIIILIILTAAIWIIRENSQHVSYYYAEIVADLSAPIKPGIAITKKFF